MEKKEAMKILKDFHDKSALFSVRTALDTIIPELKESEDEKIRRALIRFHKSTIDVDGIKGEDILAWLKKQGKQKPITDFSNLRTWKYIVDAVLTEKEGVGQYLDSPFTEELAKKLQKRFGNIEQMPIEWSEEDEAMFQGVIETEQYMLDVVYGRKTFDVGNEAIKEECTKELSWLKSLRPQKQWKSAWSEEDEEKIDFLIGLIWFQVKDDKYSFCHGDKVTQVTKGEAIDMLKSLKDRIK